MQIFARVREIWGLKQGRGGKISHFLALSVNILKTVPELKLLLMTNRKSHMGSLLTPRSMTLDDLELL